MTNSDELSLQQLRISEAKFKGIVEIASDAIISIDRERRITDFNTGAEQIFGYTAEEVYGREIEILIPERYRRMHAAHVRAFAEGPDVARRMGDRREIAGVRKNGEEFPAEASISKLAAADDQLVMTVLLRDITVRKRIEDYQRLLARAGAELAGSLELETTLSTIARLPLSGPATACFLVFIDEFEPRVVRATHADPDKEAQFARLTGAPLDIDNWSPAMEAMRSHSAVLVEDLRARLQSEPTVAPHVLRLREIGILSAVCAPLISGGRVIGALTLFSDRRHFGHDELTLTDDLAKRSALAIDNARLYRAAQHALRARDEILTVVSHDLGNPLAAIRIGTSLLLRNLREEERQSGGWQHLAAIQQSTAQMERLITDLLDTKRVEAGLLSMHIERVSARAIIDDTVELNAASAAAKNITLHTFVDPDLPSLEADAARLRQVVANLVGNALKFAPEGSDVEITARTVGSEAQFAVSDHGPGIPPSEIGHVFDRFWQPQGAERVGIGLGLAIAKGIVEAHGGRIWVQSSPVGGSTFYFTIPLSHE